MKRIKGMTEIKVSVDDINHLNELIDRDEPKPVIVKTYGDSVFICCPECERATSNDYKFCPRCGQRLDMENEAL